MSTTESTTAPVSKCCSAELIACPQELCQESAKVYGYDIPTVCKECGAHADAKLENAIPAQNKVENLLEKEMQRVLVNFIGNGRFLSLDSVHFRKHLESYSRMALEVAVTPYKALQAHSEALAGALDDCQQNVCSEWCGSVLHSARCRNAQDALSKYYSAFPKKQ